MDDERRPWEVDEALERGALDSLARYLLGIRNEVAAQHEPTKGDGPWSLGCRAYERTINRLESDLIAGRFDFLGLKRLGLYCAIFINGIPVRLYRGEPENPPNHHLQAGIMEQLQLFPPKVGRETAAEWCWMVAVQTDVSGRGIAATYLQADDSGQHRYQYTVTDGAFENVKPLTRPGIDLGPPQVDSKKKATTEATGANAKP